MSIEVIAAAIRYGSLAIERLAPELRARVEAYQAGDVEIETEGESEDDESE